MFNTRVVIAGVAITFWTDHHTDIDNLNDILFYHTGTYISEANVYDYHDVVIASSVKAESLPPDQKLVWNGTISTNEPVTWYNGTDDSENFIMIGRDILIRHSYSRKLTICHLIETKARFSKAYRPQLTCYIFFLMQSILSMYGKYCLHASCVSKDNLAYLFLGKSGDGKSTISQIMTESGYEYMGDDLTFISKNNTGEIIVDSYLSKMKLLNKKQKGKRTIDILKNENVKYTYQSKLGGVFKLHRVLQNTGSFLQPAVSHTESFAWLMDSGNNIKIQYHPQLWMETCETAAYFPSFTLMFADKDYFQSGILSDL